MTDLTIGVFGCGKIAERHLRVFQRLDSVDVVVTDVDATKRDVAHRYGARWSGSPADVLEDGDVDAVDVCTPIWTHADLITEALDAGKHVFCEKPLARTTEEVERIQRKQREHERLLMVGYLYRFHPAFQFAKEVIEDGIIGEPYYALFRVGGRGSHRAWKHQRDRGGGAANEMLVHMLDLVSWYFGDFGAADGLVSETVLKQREIEGEVIDATAEDLTLLDLTMEDDTRVFCQADLITPSYMNYIEVHGTNGSVWTTILDYLPTTIYCEEPRGIFDRGRNERRFLSVNLHEKELEHFVECIMEDKPLRHDTLETSRRIREVIESTVHARQ